MLLRNGILSTLMSWVLLIVFLEQVKVLALTDHDTMAGIPEALEAARKCGIRIIPGVEISTRFTSRLIFNAMSYFLFFVKICQMTDVFRV